MIVYNEEILVDYINRHKPTVLTASSQYYQMLKRRIRHRANVYVHYNRSRKLCFMGIPINEQTPQAS